jgi:hypothetical protein
MPSRAPVLEGRDYPVRVGMIGSCFPGTRNDTVVGLSRATVLIGKRLPTICTTNLILGARLAASRSASDHGSAAICSRWRAFSASSWAIRSPGVMRLCYASSASPPELLRLTYGDLFSPTIVPSGWCLSEVMAPDFEGRKHIDTCVVTSLSPVQTLRDDAWQSHLRTLMKGTYAHGGTSLSENWPTRKRLRVYCCADTPSRHIVVSLAYRNCV